MAEHPPVPGGIVTPNFLGVMEALSTITFPISKRDLLEQVGEGTVILRGRNVALHDLVKDLHDDFFESEDELRTVLEQEMGLAPEDVAETEGVLPTGPRDSWQSRVGPGDTAAPSSILEPPGDDA